PVPTTPRPSSHEAPARPGALAPSTDDVPGPANGAVSPAAVRAWARENGIPVGDRGRLRAEIVEQCRASIGRSGEPAPAVTPAPPTAAESPAVPAPRPAPASRPADAEPAGTRLTITPEFQAALDHLHAGHHL